MEITLSSVFDGKDLVGVSPCQDSEILMITDSTGLYLYKVKKSDLLKINFSFLIIL